MGWTGVQTRAKMDSFLTKEFTSDHPRYPKRDVLAIGEGACDGSDRVFYLARQRQDRNGSPPETGVLVVLARYEGKYLMYKEMSEGMHPFYYDCPADILALTTPLPPVPRDGSRDMWQEARDWRAIVMVGLLRGETARRHLVNLLADLRDNQHDSMATAIAQGIIDTYHRSVACAAAPPVT